MAHERMGLITASELASELKVTTATILKWARNGVIAPLRIGPRLVRFDFADVKRRLAARSVHRSHRQRPRRSSK